jgi:protein translocase SecG subunit
LVYILYTLFFVSCVLLIASVLLQPGKTDAGALFTSNISSTAFQPRGAQTILSKITIVAATVFMLSALFLAMPALTGNVSVLQTTSADTPVENAPANTSNSNVDINANAGAVVNANVASNIAVVVNNNSLSNSAVKVNTNTAKPNTTNSNKK